MNPILEAYLDIFDLVPETCKITGVKLLTTEKNESNEDVHQFICRVEAPTKRSDVVPRPSAHVKMSNWANRHKDRFGGPDILDAVVLDTKDKDGKEQKRQFVYTAHLTPESVMEFQVQDGRFVIITRGHGLFYK